MVYDPVRAAQESIAANLIPILDENSQITGFRDQRLGQQAGQPSQERLTAHLAFLEQKQPGKFEIGETIPNFDVVDPFESEGFFDSIGNIAAASLEGSLTGLAEEALHKIGRGDEKIDLFGLIDSDRIRGFRPNAVEKIGIQIASFFQPLDLVTLFVGGPALGGLAAKGALSLVGKTAIKKAGEKVLAKTVTGAVNLGTFEGSKGFFEGFIDPDQADFAQRLQSGLEATPAAALTGGILGASFGLVGGFVPAQIAGSRALGIGAEAGAEILTLGTISPFTQSRLPTVEDYSSAAGFIAGMKVVFGVPKALSKFKTEKKNIENEMKEEGESFAEFNQRVDDGAKPFISNKVVNNLLRAAEGDVFRLGDILSGKAKKHFKEIEDVRVRATREEMTDAKGEQVTGVFLPETNEYLINVNSREFIRPTIVHESAHALRNERGRSLANEVVEDLGPSLGRATNERINRLIEPEDVIGRAEVSAERLERAVAERKPLRRAAPEKARRQALKAAEVRKQADKKAIDEAIQKTGKKPEAVKTEARTNKATGEREVVVISTVEVKGKGKKRKVQNVLTVPESAEAQRELIQRSFDKAAKNKQSLFLSKQLSKNTALVKNLQVAGMLGEQVQGAFKVVSPKSGAGARLGVTEGKKAPKLPGVKGGETLGLSAKKQGLNRTIRTNFATKEAGKATRTMCKVGCIGCGICAKQTELFKIEDNLARIDYEKYQPSEQTETAMEKCPTGVIVYRGKSAPVPRQPKQKTVAATKA